MNGVIISRSGKDLGSARTSDIVFSTKNSSLPIYKEIPFELYLTTGSFQLFGSVSIPHSLGYIPVCIAYVRLPYYVNVSITDSPSRGEFQVLLPSSGLNRSQSINITPSASEITIKLDGLLWAGAGVYHVNKITGTLYIMKGNLFDES